MTSSFRHAGPDALAAALQDARRHTLALFDCFSSAGFGTPAGVPLLPTLNPPLWELGHVAWFAEWYTLRGAQTSAPAAPRHPSLLSQADDWFDSNTVSHDTRWRLGLPDAGAVRSYCREVLERLLDTLGDTANDDAALYPYRLILSHEDMHGEAFAYTLNTLGVAPPYPAVQRSPAPVRAAIEFDGGSFMCGSRPGDGFAFDNERWAHACMVSPFAIDANAVTNAQFEQFVADDGYRQPRFWSAAGLDWLARSGRRAPAGWQQQGGSWLCRRFGTMLPLPADEAVRHVNLFEAGAYCAWAGRRLPTEIEWEYAAQSNHPAFHWGEIWEWTASPFDAYPGFSPGAYLEYSAPYFGTHQVVRGASFATPQRLYSPRFRNFYLPQRDDIFVGFRSCAI